MRIPASLFLSALLIGSNAASGQDVGESYDLSNTTVQGSARSMGFGNALGSVGGDFSSLSVNPAGLGIYRNSEVSFTPSLRLNSANAVYAGSSAFDANSRFNINHIAFVFTSAPKGQRYERRDWKAVSFAFGMNRIADYNRNYTYSGYNNTSSASQAFESDANMYPGDASSTDASNAPGYIGYQSYLINQNANGQYYSIVPFSGGINQLKNVEERGRINEYVIALGGNYKEKLMLGITLGIPSIKYVRNSYYTETVAANNTTNPDNFNSFTYSQRVNITGVGINTKLGAIYKFSDMFRAGIAFHTPTWYALNDVYDPGMTANAQGYNVALLSGVDLVQNRFDYSVSTPWKGVVSATLMLNKRGFITADIEYVDHSSTRFRFPEGPDAATTSEYQQQENVLNAEVKKTYKGTPNFRLGGEARLGQSFMLRAGFGYYGDPYTEYGKANRLSYTAERIDLSLGMGFRFRHFFTDIAFVRSMYQRIEQPYSIVYNDGAGNNFVHSGSPATVLVATIDQVLNNVAWTVGFKF